MKRAVLGLVLSLGVFASAARADDRHLAVVLDTSSSMDGNDRPRYTVQATKILSDLLDAKDRMIAIRMPRRESCSDGPDPSLGVVFDPQNRAAFKSAVDSKMTFDTGTYFAGPVRTALDFLSQAPKGRRLLLIVADAGGFDPCDAPLTQAILGLRAAGGDAAVVKLGDSSGPFFGNPAFSAAHGVQTSRQLIEAIAAIYQSFLGSRKPQTGDASGRVEVTIDELVSEAFLVIAADGPIGQLTSSQQNPFAASMDLDLHGGGRTTGLDKTERGYRVARLTNPDAGKWVFEAQGLSAPAGYLLVQDYAVQIRMVSPGEVPTGRESKLSFEVVDPRTGKRVSSIPFLGKVNLTALVGGKKVDLVRGPDGTFSAPVRFDKEGKHPISVELKSDWVAKAATATVTVVRPAWALVPEVLPRADLESQVKLTVRVEPSDATASPPQAFPDRIRVQGAEGATELTDDGRNGDERAADHVYTTVWIPRTMGAHPLQFDAVGGDRATPASATVDVIGKLRFGDAVPIEIGPIRSESSGLSALNFGNVEIKGEFDLRLTSTFVSGGAAFELDPGGGFQLLSERPIALRLDSHGPKEFPVRVRTGSCPSGCTKQEPATLKITAIGPDGAPLELRVPVKVEVVSDPWLHCYWPLVVLAIVLATSGILFHGYWSPSRFAPRLGIKLSPEEDIEEGVFYTIRAQSGTASGFYRDARAFVSSDFRISGRSRGAVARLRAQGSHVMIEPVSGASVQRQTSDGEWEELETSESRVRFGTLYRDDKGKIYFQLRTG